MTKQKRQQCQPNYKNSIVNFAASLMKLYGVETKYESHALVDFILSKKYRHVAVILLDGMGIKNIDDNLSNGSILRTHQIMSLTSVYPPTTVAATTAFLDGRAPIESGWLGWHLYLDENDPSVCLFSGKEYYNDVDFDKYKVQDKLPVRTFYNKLKRAKGYGIYGFGENAPATFADAIAALEENFAKDESNFTYLYWPNPDSLMHEYGTTSQMVKVCLIDIENQIKKLSETISEDTIVFVTADHGLVDVEPLDLAKFPDVKSHLRKKISGEGRFAQFYVKEGEDDAFKEAFNTHFQDYFKLYSKQEFIASHLAGLYQPNELINTILGDYCAIATSKYFFCDEIKVDSVIFKAAHAGLTDAELKVPVILLKKTVE